MAKAGSKGKFWTVVATLVMSLLLLEGLSFIAFRIRFGQWFRPAAMHEMKNRLVAEAQAARDAVQPKQDPAAVVPHPYLGFVYNPNYDPAGMAKLHSVPVSPWGLLDDKSPVQAGGPDEVVVGIFGGSVAFWFSVQGIDAMLAELAAVPEFQGKRFVVVRTALGGTKQPQQLLTLTYLLAQGAHFDVVVTLDGLNDIAIGPGWLVPQGINPYFPRDWPRLLGESGDPNLLRLAGRVAYLEELRGERAARFQKRVLRYSPFANTLWRAMDQSLERDLERARFEIAELKPQLAGERKSFAGMGPAQTYASPDAMYRDLASFWSRSSRAMSDLCAARGIAYVHFLQPNQYLEGSKPMSAAERKVALWPGSAWEQSVRAGYPLMLQGGADLAAHGVAFHDLTQVFSTISQPLYHDSCCHFSPEGNRIMGQAMGKAIVGDLATASSAPTPAQSPPAAPARTGSSAAP